MSSIEENRQADMQVRLVDGTLIHVPGGLQLLTTYVLREQGDWFEEEIKFLRNLVQPGQTIIDIGANYGVYALSLARRVGPTGRVWAFEPATDTANFLAAAIDANHTPWVCMERLALSDHEGLAWLRKPGQSELNRLAAPAAPGSPVEVGESVQVTTLDAYVERCGWRDVDLLKMDAEGEERRILSGGSRFFRDASPLVMFELKEGDRLHLELIESFQELGYRCFRLLPGLPALVPFDPDEGVDGFLLNLFAAKPDRVATLAAAGWLLDTAPRQTTLMAPGLVEAPDRLSRLEASPYGRLLLPLWQRGVDQPGWAENRAALAAWERANDRTLTLEDRWLALRRSYILLHTLCQDHPSAGRCASLARVALALGERSQSLRALAQLLARLGRDGEAGLAEPFLPPHPDYASIDPRGRPLAWLESAALEAQECYGSYSSFFVGAAGLPRLERLAELGLASPAMACRLQLVQAVFLPADSVRPAMPEPEPPEEESVTPWFESLELVRPLRCLVVGAAAMAEKDEPFVRWAREGCADVLRFALMPDESNQHHQELEHLKGQGRHCPFVLGDGQEHTFNITRDPMMSSLLPPARSTFKLLSGLDDGMRIERSLQVRTSRLDDLADIRPVDVLKLDLPGINLMVLQNAIGTLADVSLVQCKVEFVELYEGQPLMPAVDAFMRSQGFMLLRFGFLKGLPIPPVRLANDSFGGSQLLWADAVYIRDYRQCEQWSNRQLQAAAFVLHVLYRAFDVVALLLRELDRRQQSDWHSLYLASLLFSEPTIQLE